MTNALTVINDDDGTDVRVGAKRELIGSVIGYIMGPAVTTLGFTEIAGPNPFPGIKQNV